MTATNSNDGYYARVLNSMVKKMNAEKLVPYLRNVVQMMTDNEDFTEPVPALAAMTTQINLLDAAELAARDRGRLAIATRNAEWDTTVGMAVQLGSYVETTANGDLVVLLSSGFDATRQPTPVGVLGAPERFTLSQTGISGEMLAKWKRVKNAANFTVEIGSTPEGPFETQPPCTSAKLLLTGLTPLKTYWVRVCANGSAGPGAWSLVISMIVL